MLTQKKYFVLCDSKLNPIDDNDEASDRGLVADWVDGFSKETQHSSTMWHLNWKCENRGFDDIHVYRSQDELQGLNKNTRVRVRSLQKALTGAYVNCMNTIIRLKKTVSVFFAKKL